MEAAEHESETEDVELSTETQVGQKRKRTDREKDLEADVKADSDVPKSLDLRWLVRKLNYEIKTEIKFHPHTFSKRTFIFKWMAAVCLQLDNKILEKYYLNTFLRSLIREKLIMDSNFARMRSRKHDPKRQNSEKQIEQRKKQAKFRLLLQHLFDLIKGIVGNEAYALAYAKIYKELTHIRSERKKRRAQAVSNLVFYFCFD